MHCRDKLAFETEAAARRHRYGCRGGKVYIYLCMCGKYHFTKDARGRNKYKTRGTKYWGDARAR